jgi:hypothetical protein
MTTKRRAPTDTAQLEESLGKRDSDESNMSNRSQPRKPSKRTKTDAPAPKASLPQLTA